jgi:hypothetical protein
MISISLIITEQGNIIILIITIITYKLCNWLRAAKLEYLIMRIEPNYCCTIFQLTDISDLAV